MTAPACRATGSEQGGPGADSANRPQRQRGQRASPGAAGRPSGGEEASGPRGARTPCVRPAPPLGGWATLGGSNGLSAVGEAVCARAGGAHPCRLWGLRSLEEKFLEAPGKPKGRRVVGERKKKKSALGKASTQLKRGMGLGRSR